MSSKFIKNKIILRSLIASIAPVILYSIGYGITALFVDVSFPFFSLIPWLIIAGVSAIYPINRIGLVLLFEPASWMLRRSLKIDYNKLLDGNFARIDEDG